jgi:hypothetical protein
MRPKIDHPNRTSTYWVGILGSQTPPRGPLGFDEIRDQFLRKEIPADAIVCKVGESTWLAIASVMPLSAAPTAPTGLPLPPSAAARGAVVELPLPPSSSRSPGLPAPSTPAGRAAQARLHDGGLASVGNAAVKLVHPVPNIEAPPAGSSVVDDPRGEVRGADALPVPQPRVAASRRLVARIAAGFLGLAIIAGGALLVAKYRAMPPRALPLVAARLPARTTKISESRLRSDLDEAATLPDLIIVSALSEAVCGGVDVAKLLAAAHGKDLAWMKRAGLLDLAGSQTVRDGLTCASAVQREIAAPTLMEVTFIDGDKPRTVNVIRSSMLDLPANIGFVRHNFSGLPGDCLKKHEEKADCQDGAFSAFHDGSTWGFGPVEAIEGFARAYTTSHTELTSNVEILQETVLHTEGADETVIVAKPETIPWKMVCERAAPLGHQREFLEACFPSGQDRLLEQVTAKVRGVAIERDLLAKAAAFNVGFVLLARDDDAARDIEKDLLDLIRDWRAHIANREPDVLRLLRAPSEYIHDRFWEAASDPLLRAIRSASVTRDGASVHFGMRAPLRPAEAKLVKEFVETHTEDQVAATKIIEAILANLPIPEKSLSTFVGADVAAWIAAPRASEADCTSILGQLKTLTSGDVPIELFGLKFELEQRYTMDRCKGVVLPPEVKSCFLEAASLKAFGTCKLPVSPFALYATRRLAGQWEGIPVKTTRRGARPTRLEFGNGKVALTVGEDVSEVDAGIQSDDSDRAEFNFPAGKEKSIRAAIIFDGDDKFHVAGSEAGFKRATFPKSILRADLAAEPAPGATSAAAKPAAAPLPRPGHPPSEPE